MFGAARARRDKHQTGGACVHQTRRARFRARSLVAPAIIITSGISRQRQTPTGAYAAVRTEMRHGVAWRRRRALRRARPGGIYSRSAPRGTLSVFDVVNARCGTHAHVRSCASLRICIAHASTRIGHAARGGVTQITYAAQRLCARARMASHKTTLRCARTLVSRRANIAQAVRVNIKHRAAYQQSRKISASSAAMASAGSAAALKRKKRRLSARRWRSVAKYRSAYACIKHHQ